MTLLSWDSSGPQFLSEEAECVGSAPRLPLSSQILQAGPPMPSAVSSVPASASASRPLLWYFFLSRWAAGVCLGECSGPSHSAGLSIPFSLVSLWVREMPWGSWAFRLSLLPFEHSGLDCCCSKKRKGRDWGESPGRNAPEHDGPSLIPRTHKKKK